MTKASKLTDGEYFSLVSTIVEAVSTTAKTLIRWGFAALMVYFFSLALRSFAGQRTDAHVVMNLIAKIGIDRWVAYLFGGGGIAYGLSERRLRQKNIERLTPDRHQKELLVDPNRSSSGLTPSGLTNPEDL